MFKRHAIFVYLTFILLVFWRSPLQADAMLQLFNLTWEEMTQKIPEIAEAGYSSLWLPPPTKGGSGYSAGYDVFDPFDLGDKNQRGTVRTRYGAKAELLRMIEVAHRFGLRVYFDNIMNHRAFDVPRYDANTPTNLYPGMAPQDFHLRSISGNFYRNVDNIRDYNSAWQVQNLSLGGLVDIAHENPNANFGPYEGTTAQKLSFVRHPSNPEYYDYHPTLGQVGFGRITQAVLSANPNFYAEDVNAYLIRAARYLLDQTKCDGFRLDAVKHVPSYFFGQQSGANKDGSAAGYVGNIQLQFNLTHGYTDANQRNSNFDTEMTRNDALVFGEHLGEPPAYRDFSDAGMRLLDNPLRNYLNNVLGNPGASLAGLEQRDFGGFSAGVRVMHAQSHDNDYAAHRELQNAYYFMREGVPIIYSDGYHKSPTCNNCGAPFPRHANAPYLGQFGDNKMPDVAFLHHQLARGGTRPRWGDNDVVVFERYDYREPGNAADQTVVLFAMNDNYGYPGDISFDDGVAQTTSGTYYECFPVENSRGQGLVVGFPPGSVLAQLADSPGKDRACSKLLVRLATNNKNDAEATKNDSNPINRKVYVGGQALAPGGGAIELKIPGGSYVMYGYQWPEPSRAAGGVIVFRQGGREAPRLTIYRQDGKDGDRGFNPIYPFKMRGSMGPDNSVIGGTNAGPFVYAIDVPVVTNAPVDIEMRVDASAINGLIKLDGGLDLNSHLNIGPTNGFDRRDNPPGTAYDLFLGYEQIRFIRRCGPEKFGALNVTRNTVVSQGAETYYYTVGRSSAVVQGSGGGSGVDTDTADWVYHNPNDGVAAGPSTQRVPVVPSAADSVAIWIKVSYQFDIDHGYIYYTTNGSNPEGAFGVGQETTLVAPLSFDHLSLDSGTGRNVDWWRGVIPAQANGVLVKYKVAFFKSGISPISDANSDKVFGLTQFAITGFNPAQALVWRHNNLNTNHTITGLPEGFHMVRARSFLPRDGKASVFNTHLQTFYFDAGPPQGVIAYPAANGDTLGSKEYGVVIRADATANAVEFNIQDHDPNNDDATTGQSNGNGLTNGAPVFGKATPVNPTASLDQQYPDLPREFRFSYLAVPASEPATITIRIYEATSAIFSNRFTTIVRTITAAAPAQTLNIAYPPNNGDTLNQDPVAPYTIVSRFTESLATNINQFALRIDGAEQARSLYRFEDQMPGDGKNELRFDWSGMSPGQHLIEVQFHGPGLSLEALRIVNVNLVGVDTAIISPPAANVPGQPYVIVLPAKTNPAPAERSWTIITETAATVTNVLISFSPTNAAFNGGAAVLDTNFAGSTRRWWFVWTNMVEGQFTIQAAAFATGSDTATRVVQVVLRPPDADGDGLPDNWENQFLLNARDATGDHGASGDPDHDGFSNLEEYLAGTNPQDPNSLLRVVGAGPDGQRITWASVPGKTYQVLATTNLFEPFFPLTTNLIATGASTTFTDSSSPMPRRFYRVGMIP